MNRWEILTKRIEDVETIASCMDDGLGSLPIHHDRLMSERYNLTLDEIEGVE